jgi:hypothetical protein
MHLIFMEEIIDLIATDSSPSEVSNKIKEILFSKSAEKIESTRPLVASSLFGEIENEGSVEGQE